MRPSKVLPLPGKKITTTIPWGKSGLMPTLFTLRACVTRSTSKRAKYFQQAAANRINTGFNAVTDERRPKMDMKKHDKQLLPDNEPSHLQRLYRLEATVDTPLTVKDRSEIRLLAMAGRGGSY